MLINLGVLFTFSKLRNRFYNNNKESIVIKSINLFKKEVGILWEDDTETYITYDDLRRLCPCAFCSGETDVLGNIYGGTQVVPGEGLVVLKFKKVGFYGLQFFFSDGHKDGIYTFPLLKNYKTKP